MYSPELYSLELTYCQAIGGPPAYLGGAARIVTWCSIGPLNGHCADHNGPLSAGARSLSLL